MQYGTCIQSLTTQRRLNDGNGDQLLVDKVVAEDDEEHSLLDLSIPKLIVLVKVVARDQGGKVPQSCLNLGEVDFGHWTRTQTHTRISDTYMKRERKRQSSADENAWNQRADLDR